ncbi:terpene cyclase/mutase family protein [Streptomyces sp. DSM 44917]|uniref:Terpene cyclase/mutase family protein n=1 Tax=Streptomyces boetiae TaxID=3075541 RepID=A0ABU2L3E9_9ACTN|nr:prenyltransferase/squalene oxidase repeat-containing protein [Streptomyces sp. DSM 44917]MDT0306085.1 terpene cyclase/mutase family protein [Streptomyces sp. DSM 44917]
MTHSPARPRTRPAPGRRPGGGRSLAALAAAAALLATAALPSAAAALPATAPSTAQTEEAQDALFGEGDPTYDGVFRQSFALLAQSAAGYTPASAAVEWLLAQQCEDGSFLPHRADPAQPCEDVTAADSNATALAVQALSATGGHEEAVSGALRWLTGVQNEDGGWGYSPGNASDANSTSVVVGAFLAAGQDPAEVRRGQRSPYDALDSFQLGCDAPQETERGAFAWQPDEAADGALAANPLASADAVLASYGSGFLVAPDAPAAPVAPLDCGDTGDADGDTDSEADGGAEETPTESGEPGATETPGSPRAASASAGAAYLAGLLADGEQHLVSAPPGGEEQPDFSATARAVLALAAGGHREAWQGPLGWLRDHHGEWTGYQEDPTALSLLVLAAHAGGLDPGDFGGEDLTAALNRLGPAPDESPDDASGGAGAADGEDDGGLSPVVWVIALGLAIGIALGVALVLRRSRKPTGA